MQKNGTLGQIWKAVRQMNPTETASEAGKRFTLALVGSGAEIADMRNALLGLAFNVADESLVNTSIITLSPPLDSEMLTRLDQSDLIFVLPDAADAPLALEKGECDISDFGFRISDFPQSGLGVMVSGSSASRYPEKLAVYDPADPSGSIARLLSTERGKDLRLALARCFPALRQEVTKRIIREISSENATFVIVTALGDIIPSVLEPILGITEAAGDTVFLTANQVRMLFLIGAVYGVDVGYFSQWKEISSVIGAAFGWRALARNLVSKIPFGGGLAPKGAIAYTGTYVAGEGARYYYSTGRHMTRDEIAELFKRIYDEALAFAKTRVRRNTKSLPGK